MNWKEFFKPTWKKIVLFTIFSILNIIFLFFSRLLSIFLAVFSTDLFFFPFFLIYLFSYVLSCLLMFFWNKFRGIKKERIRGYEIGIFIGIIANAFVNILADFIPFLYFLYYFLLSTLNYPFYLIFLQSDLGYRIACLLNGPICSYEGAIFLWNYLIPIISGIIYGGMIGFIVYIIRGKDDQDKIRKLRKGTLIVVMVLVLIGLIFLLVKLYKISVGCDYKKVELEMRVYDSQGRVTGLVNGEGKLEIPRSSYHTGYFVGPEYFPQEVLIFKPEDSYIYEFFCTKKGSYRFSHSFGSVSISSTSIDLGPASTIPGTISQELGFFKIEDTYYQEERKKFNFNAYNIPCSPGQTHQYHFDWEVLARGEEGATILIDENNDGVFEKNIISDKELTCEEFKLKTNKISRSSIIFLKTIFISIACVLIIIFVIIIIYIIKHKKSAP